MKRATQSTVRRFAQAFLSVFGKKLTDQDRTALARLTRDISHARNRFIFLSLNTVTAERKIHALERLCEAYQLPDMFKVLMRTLVEKHVALLVPKVLKQIVDHDERYQNIESFSIESSCPLVVSDQKILEAFLAEQTGKQIRASYRIDPSLIAGVRMYSGEHLWDYSLRQRLGQLRKVAESGDEA